MTPVRHIEHAKAMRADGMPADRLLCRKHFTVATRTAKCEPCIADFSRQVFLYGVPRNVHRVEASRANAGAAPLLDRSFQQATAMTTTKDHGVQRRAVVAGGTIDCGLM